MTGPRNKPAAAKSAREREIVKAALLEHAREHPLARQPTAKELLRLTGLTICERRVQQHVESIRLEAELSDVADERTDTIACARRNSSAPDVSLG